jgi:hypothetical protein
MRTYRPAITAAARRPGYRCFDSVTRFAVRKRIYTLLILHRSSEGAVVPQKENVVVRVCALVVCLANSQYCMYFRL